MRLADPPASSSAPPSMGEPRPLGRTGITVAPVALGTKGWAGIEAIPGEPDPRWFVDLPASTLVDTAAVYGRGEAERVLHARIQAGAPRIATKFSPALWHSPESLLEELDASLARLGVRSVTLYQIHYPTPLLPLPALLVQLARAVRTGRAEAVGVSNFSAEQLRFAHRILAEEGVPLASNQVQYSLLHRAPEDDGTLAACRALGVTLLAWAPLARGLLARPPALGDRHAADDHPPGAAPVLRAVAEVARLHGRSPAEVALRWLLEDPMVVPIAGTRHLAHAAADTAGWTLDLSPDERDHLRDALPRRGRPRATLVA